MSKNASAMDNKTAFTPRIHLSRRDLLRKGLPSVMFGGGFFLAFNQSARASGIGNYVGILPSGGILYPNYTVYSDDYQLTLTLQDDGNLVFYECGNVLWASGTNGIAVTSCNMQLDGNLVLYNGPGNAVWATGTDGYTNSYLGVQGDGNLVVYDPWHRAVWASNTSTLGGVSCGG